MQLSRESLERKSRKRQETIKRRLKKISANPPRPVTPESAANEKRVWTLRLNMVCRDLRTLKAWRENNNADLTKVRLDEQELRQVELIMRGELPPELGIA